MTDLSARCCVTQHKFERSTRGGALRDETKNGCVGDYAGAVANVNFSGFEFRRKNGQAR